MFCKNCGKQIDNDSRFCPECGAEVDRNEDETYSRPLLNLKAMNLQRNQARLF